MKKSLAIASAITSIGLASIASVGLVGAAQSTTSGSNTLVDKIAQKFNLNKDDVQKVFDEDRQTHEAEHGQKQADRIAQAVKDGKLTQEQADKITAKLKELKAQREAERDSMKDKTEEERRIAMETRRAELEKWAKDNNIPLEYLHGLGGRGRVHGFRAGGAPKAP